VEWDLPIWRARGWLYKPTLLLLRSKHVSHHGPRGQRDKSPGPCLLSVRQRVGSVPPCHLRCRAPRARAGAGWMVVWNRAASYTLHCANSFLPQVHIPSRTWTIGYVWDACPEEIPQQEEQVLLPNVDHWICPGCVPRRNTTTREQVLLRYIFTLDKIYLGSLYLAVLFESLTLEF
jgi:hypothetical protein